MKWFYGLLTVSSIFASVLSGINNSWFSTWVFAIFSAVALFFTIWQISDDHNKNKKSKTPPNDFQI
jgi:hypothetical protein